MTFRNWLFLFFTTLAIGGVTILVTSSLLNWDGFQAITQSWEEFLAGSIFLLAVGLTFSAVSQMSFFAYLLVNRLALGLFRSKKMWHNTQVVLILFTFFDLVYFRYSAFAQEGESWFSYMLMPTLFFGATVILAYFKVKQTRTEAFVPSLFLLFVVTTIATIPALMINDMIWVKLMLITVLICHTWQLFLLPRLNQPLKEKSA